MIFEETSPHLAKNTNLLSGKTVSVGIRNCTDAELDHLKEEFNTYYYGKGWGLKLVARNVLGITYTQIRSFCRILDISYRRGRDVVTDASCKFRKDKASHESVTEIGFRDPSIKRYAKSNARGVHGYFYNSSTDSYVWLRSSYEFIYAKFLNKIGCNWKTEQTYFGLSDGTKYSPDFYIYSDDWELLRIVEIKGYFDNRAYKCKMLKDEFFNECSVDVVLIRDIKLFIEEGTTYSKELKTWKTVRKSKEFILNELK